MLLRHKKREENIMQKVLCVGEMMVDLIAYPIDQVLLQCDYHPMDSLLVKTGGDAHNNAVDMARLGNDVTYIGRIGYDMFAANCLEAMRREGVNVDHVIFSKTAEQAKSLILMGEGDQRTFYQNFGTSEEFCFEDINLEVLDRVSMLQIGGTFHMKQFDEEGAVRLLKLAKSKGIITSLDVTMDRSGRWNSVLEPYYPYLDYFMPSIEQAREIANIENPWDIARFLLDRGVKNVIIKDGKSGSYFCNANSAFSCDSYEIQAVDTTGAGDAFVSGFLTGVGKGFSPEECIVFATACSAHVIQEMGATAGMKDFDTIMRFIKLEKELKIAYDTKGK